MGYKKAPVHPFKAKGQLSIRLSRVLPLKADLGVFGQAIVTKTHDADHMRNRGDQTDTWQIEYVFDKNGEPFRNRRDVATDLKIDLEVFGISKFEEELKRAILGGLATPEEMNTLELMNLR